MIFLFFFLAAPCLTPIQNPASSLGTLGEHPESDEGTRVRFRDRRRRHAADQIRSDTSSDAKTQIQIRSDTAPRFFFFNQIRPDTARDPPVRDANGWHSPSPKHLPSPCFRECTHWPIQWLIWLAAHPPGWQLAGPQRGPNAQDDNHLDAAFAAAAVPSSFSRCSCCCSFPCFFFQINCVDKRKLLSVI